MSRQNPRPTFVIAISGVSGAGKTTLVKRVAALLDDAVALHFDDYQPVAKYPTDLAGWIAAGKDLDAWEIPHPGGHLRQLLTDLKALRQGQAVYIPDTLTWGHETVEEAKRDQKRYIELEHISMVPALVESLKPSADLNS